MVGIHSGWDANRLHTQGQSSDQSNPTGFRGMGGQTQIYTTTHANPRETSNRARGVGEFSRVMDGSVRLGKWRVWREAKSRDDVSSVDRQLHSPPVTTLTVEGGRDS